MQLSIFSFDLELRLKGQMSSIERLLRAWFAGENCLHQDTWNFYLVRTLSFAQRRFRKLQFDSELSGDGAINQNRPAAIDLRTQTNNEGYHDARSFKVYRVEKNRNRSGVTYTQHFNRYSQTNCRYIQLSELWRKTHYVLRPSNYYSLYN